MTIYISDDKTGQILKTLHSYDEFIAFQAKQGRKYKMRPTLYGTYTVYVNEHDLK